MKPQRKLTDQNRLQGWSLPEIKTGLDLMVIEMSIDMDPVRRGLKPTHVLNTLVLHFLKRMTDDERKEMMTWGIDELNRLLSLEEPEPIRGTHVITRHPKPKAAKKGDGAKG